MLNTELDEEAFKRVINEGLIDNLSKSEALIGTY